MVQIPEPTSRLIGGQEVGPNDYPGVFYTAQGPYRCTGTLIGSRVVASASHCMDDGGELTLEYKGKQYTGTCTHAPEYGSDQSGNPTADWALCLLSEGIPDAIAESVNTDANRVTKGTELTLTGYGCTQPGGGGDDGEQPKLRVGHAPITEVPWSTDTYNSYDLVTTGSSALCFGDSGGPSFVVDATTGKRYQTGINSRGNISDTSYLSALHVPSAQAFYKSWAEQNGVKICGIHSDATGCR
jgi:hypothetical protein